LSETTPEALGTQLATADEWTVATIQIHRGDEGGHEVCVALAWLARHLWLTLAVRGHALELSRGPRQDIELAVP